MNNFPAMTELQRQERIKRFTLEISRLNNKRDAAQSEDRYFSGGDLWALQAFEIALAALTSPPASVLRVPGGWKLVPVEPTREMREAIINGIDYDIYPEGIYSDVLAVAPAFLGEKSKPYGWVAEYPTIPAGIGGITYSFHDNRDDAQEEADAYNGHVVEVIRR